MPRKNVVFALAVVTMIASGCGRNPRVEPKANVPAVTEPSGTKHAGWWCEEHGVPESQCSLCSAKVASRLKKEGDWCALHDRAQSQCFKCDPSKYARFEAMYENKFGSKPPRPPEEEFVK